MTDDTPYLGHFEEINRGIARGWMIYRPDHNQKVIVELICDGYIVGFDRADVARPDLLRRRPDVFPVEDICFGFEIYVPPHALEAGKAFWVRIANDVAEFHPEKPYIKDRFAQKIEGEVAAYGGLGLTGWVHPQNDDGTVGEIIVLEDDEEIFRFKPDPFLSKTEAKNAPTLIRTFRQRLPLSLADGKTHHLDVETQAGDPLNGSPVTIGAWVQGPRSLVRDMSEQADQAPALHGSIAALDLALEKATFVQPASADFTAYPEWVPHFGPPSASGETDTFTVVIYGPAPDPETADATRASVAAQAATAPLLEIGTAKLDPQDWPRSGHVAFLRDGDRLHPDALSCMAQMLKTHAVAYSDCDQEVAGTVHPWFKPDWDPFLFIAQGYAFGLLATRAETYSATTAQTAENIVTQALNTAHPDVGHCDHVLYHHQGAAAHGAAPVNPDRFRESLDLFEVFEKSNAQVKPADAAPWINRLSWPTQVDLPKVSILIPTRDHMKLLKTALDSIRETTIYPDYEIIVIDNNSHKPETLDYFDSCRAEGIRILPYPGSFNFSAINNAAVAAATGDVVCLLNNDVEIIDPHWLTEMVQALQMPGVGIVGAKLLWETDIVQHGGVILGIDGGAAHIGNTWSEADMGYAGLNHVFRQNTCVTAACLVVRKADYDALGGLDPHAFPVTFNDVDFCLRMRASGKAVLWTPQAKLLHLESASRGRDVLADKMARAQRELNNLRRRWGDVLLHDPFYNQNLNRDRAPYEGLALPPTPCFSRGQHD